MFTEKQNMFKHEFKHDECNSTCNIIHAAKASVFLEDFNTFSYSINQKKILWHLTSYKHFSMEQSGLKFLFL